MSTRSAIASDSAEGPPWESDLPIALTPIRNTPVISSLLTTRVAVASIQPRCHRFAWSLTS